MIHRLRKNRLVETVLTPAELANRWKSTPATIRSMIDAGRLRGFRVGGRHRILLGEVERYEGLEGDRHETDKEKALAALD